MPLIRTPIRPGSPLAKAIDHLANGGSSDALAAAAEACTLAPDSPEAHYVHGQACAALDRPAEAEAAFLAAVRLRPAWPDAWVNYGLARYAQGAVEHAKRAMARALAVEPGHGAATANLGALQRVTGHHAAAETLLRDGLRAHADNAAARLNLVGDLLQDGRAAEALDLLAEAEPPSDVHTARHWHLQRALVLVAVGRPADARGALDAFDALGPAPAAVRALRQWRLVTIALAEGHISTAQAEACLMEEAMAAAGVAPLLEHRIMAHYDLAKFWSGHGAHARAFGHWTAGHAILKTIQPFSRGRAEACADAAVAAFTAERFATGPRASNRDSAPVFIVGMPRSGTTLCEQILAAHGAVHGAGERTALGRLVDRLSGGDPVAGLARIAALPRDALDAAADAYLEDLHALAPDATRIVDKMPGNHAYAWLIALLFPEARIIHCTRDPRDIGLSIFTFRFHGDHGYAHDLADLGWAIAEQDRMMAHWKAVLPTPILTLRLSDWVEDFDATLARVLDHLDLPPDPACARFHEADRRVHTVSRQQVRQPVNARGLGRWKAYAAELAPLIAELARAGALDAWPDGTSRPEPVEARPRDAPPAPDEPVPFPPSSTSLGEQH